MPPLISEKRGTINDLTYVVISLKLYLNETMPVRSFSIEYYIKIFVYHKKVFRFMQYLNMNIIYDMLRNNET